MDLYIRIWRLTSTFGDYIGQARAVPRFAAAKAGYEHSLLLDSTGFDAPIAVHSCRLGALRWLSQPPLEDVGMLYDARCDRATNLTGFAFPQGEYSPLERRRAVSLAWVTRRRGFFRRRS